MRPAAVASCGLALLIAGWTTSTSAGVKTSAQPHRARKAKAEEGLAS
jgi:hypothetical protein